MEESAREVPMVATPLGELELAAVLRDAYHHVFEKDISSNALACSWSQCALEHGRGKHIFCHNIGNVTAFGKWTGDYYVITFSRKANPHDAPAGDAPTFKMKFRAHDDFIDGARDYYRVLSGRYASVLPIFDAGDPDAAARKLRALGYYTAPENHYARAMVQLFAHARDNVLTEL